MQQGHSSLIFPNVGALIDIATGSLELLDTSTWTCLRRSALQLEGGLEFVGI